MATDRTAGRFSARLVEAIHTRLELFGFEFGEERDRVLATLVLVMVAGVFVFVGLLAFNLALVLAFWEQRLLVAALLATGYLGVGLVLGVAAGNRLRDAPAPFASTIEELRKDADAFRRGGSE
jgi:uncharacterized membrane protein YqjE